MTITAQMVKDLRELTGAGMMDSKKALQETDGNVEAAIEYLRKKGLAGAEKKAGRIAAEGIVMSVVSDDYKSGALVEVNSETDFVAKNEKFRTYVGAVASQALKSTNDDMEKFLAEPWILDASKTVKDELSTQISTIGENMNIRRKIKIENKNGLVYDYIHGGGRIGVLVSVDTNVVNDSVKEMAKCISMQIAAMNPKFVDQSEVDADFIKKEKEIILEEAKNDPKNAGKPDNILQGMVEGRFKKEMKEFCLYDQENVISAGENKETVGQYIDRVKKANNAEIKVVKFVRYETGEGLEKKNEDFAAEVAKQIG